MPDDDLFSLLQELPLFVGTTRADFDVLRPLITVRDVPVRSIVLERGQRAGSVCVLLAGSVKIFVAQPDDRATLVGLLGRGEVLGELSVLDRLYHSASVATMEPSRIAYIEEEGFTNCLETMPRLSLNLARILARRLRRITDQFEALAMLDVPGRVIRQLLVYAHDYGEPIERGGTFIPLRLTQTDLAGLNGASREGVNRVIAFHRRMGQLDLTAQYRFTLYDTQGLAHYHRLPWPII
jgi:CRP/FNR family cyclic AMP-dependent transcriptional regulator